MERWIGLWRALSGRSDTRSLSEGEAPISDRTGGTDPRTLRLRVLLLVAGPLDRPRARPSCNQAPRMSTGTALALV